MAKAAYEKIRQEALDKITDERARLIVGSQFSATPAFEERYCDYISEIPLYLGIYTRWVLDQSPLPPLPTEPELYRLREDILGIHGVAEPKKIILNEPLFAFLLDLTAPFLDRLIMLGREYYESNKNDREAFTATREAAFSAILLCDDGHVRKQGYPDLVTAFLDAFKIYLSKELGALPAVLPPDNAEFAQAVEAQWQRLLPYSDFLYGFEVVPAIAPDAMLRYLKLPFTSERHSNLLKQQTYRQINNYVVVLATFKPVPDMRVKTYFRQQLCSLYLPLAEKIAKREAKKKGQQFSEDDLRAIVIGEIANAAKKFDFFYATKKNLGRGSAASPNIFPLNDSYLAKLGHLSANDEFPFTDYLQQRLATRMKLFFAADLKRSRFSLDDKTSDEDSDGRTRIDTTADDPETAANNALHIPDYDAKDKDENAIGWTRDTFAGIIGKSRDTLKRWDKDGSLVAKRYPIYSVPRKRTVRYRAYTHEDVEKAKDVSILKAKRARHQK